MSGERTFNLTPHPRILPMLGEIVLPQWKCLAELIDNSVDGFLEAERAGKPISEPQVDISLPTDAKNHGQISVKDNGPGMDFETLERAARAGWTSHDPINNLGLFGMGFNIATARLGMKTTIWTTRSGDQEWVGMSIDFDQLSKAQGFVTPALTRPKVNSGVSGTEIVIERLKTEQAEWFAKGANRNNVGKLLGRTYSAMLGAGQPVRYRLGLNGPQVRPKHHCIWGGPDVQENREFEHPTMGTIEAYQPIDFPLAPRDFCLQCWNWLSIGQADCPQCLEDGKITNRKRRVHGWIGLQRFLDTTDFGFDFLRNGRKIEIGNKELFAWYDEAADTSILEYPIDDPRNRGRFVGEIHIDHCRVPYTKDRFVREDAAWAEMVALIRGSGPLQPEKARDRGFSGNISPLFKLFQAYRRSNPQSKKVGRWTKLLVVEDNNQSISMAKRFDAGEREYQTDEKWWELAKQADEKILNGGNPATPAGALGGEEPGDGLPLGGLGNGGDEQLGGDGAESAPKPLPVPVRILLPDLSQLYIEDSTGQRFDVKAFAVTQSDPGLVKTGSPWAIWRTTAGPWEFLVDFDHQVFGSVTMTPLDALLMQIAWQVTDYARDQAPSFSKILSNLRSRYAKKYEIDPATLSRVAERQLQEVAKTVVGKFEPNVLQSFFDELGFAKEHILVTMAKRGVASPKDGVSDGRFLQYSSPATVRDFVLKHIEAFLDGGFWDDAYSSLDYGTPVATQVAKDMVITYYSGLLADAVWLAEQGEAGLVDSGRDRLLRAASSIQILSMGAASGPSLQ